MVSFECTVQAGSVAAGLSGELVPGLARAAADVLGASAGDGAVEFTVVPRGSGFTAGEPSSTSIVIADLAEGCSYEARKDLMEQVCAMWYRATGCSSHELVVFTTDPTLHHQKREERCRSTAARSPRG